MQVPQSPVVAVPSGHQLVVQLACVLENHICLSGCPGSEAKKDGDVVDGNEVVLVQCLCARKQRVVVVKIHVSSLDHVRTYSGQVFVLPGQTLSLEGHDLNEARQGPACSGRAQK
jgi:hypothetical protein